ncbi:MAG: restriction endonuclease [Bacteroidetes bacterium]|nr:MAG: restriction endonuclease [Bacteroidota bacterium]TAG89885.1 MAG: restriction endonuclease [Bacteroidota bacterium]
MEENNRKNHPKFTEYQEFIVSHPNYAGLQFKRKENNNIVWVAPKVTSDGKLRDIWWQNQAKKLGIEIKAGFYVKIAVTIHPTKLHTCQICGKSLSIFYVYPNSNTLKKINQTFETDFQPFEKTIFEIIDTISNKLEAWKNIFNLNKNTEVTDYQLLKDWIQKEQVDTSSKSFFSSGVMSNAPDRFDGFHSDGNCCRSKSDKGRSKENLQRYGQDRRVYENWADGDWKQADRLMSMFRKFGLSADHIGPISLGFCHRPKFHPLTREENSAKNNRMSFSDMQVLIADEKNGEQVVSWHSKYIWDKLKNKVKNDNDALKLSKLMRLNLHWVLMVFAMIDEKGFRDFLMQFLNLDYSNYDYKFPDFQLDGTFTKIIKTDKKGKNQENNKERYVRVAFESLEEYKNKENRRVTEWENENIDNFLKQLFEFLEQKNNSKAKEKLHEILQLLAQEITQNWEKEMVYLKE